MNSGTVTMAKPAADLILAELEFTRTLSLERKRTERSRRPFVLMLVDLGPNLAHDEPSREKVLSTLAQSTRETDITGWYEEGCVLGVIFTEIGPAEGRIVVNALLIRVNETLSKTLSAAQVNEIRLSFHVFPEDWGGDDAGGKANATFYPDLTRERDSKRTSHTVKRSLDILGSLTALVLLVPVFVAVAVVIKLSSRGKVFFSQRRVGLYGKTFTFLKFRSMYSANDPSIHREYVKRLIVGVAESEMTPAGGEAPIYKLTNDPRVTPVGRFLRRTSLDELPQFWNVLKGEMSLVGPRPPVPYEFEVYDVWHKRRLLEVKPGITGLWQVGGRSRVTFDEMVRLDLRYARSWSLGLDLKILLQTPRAMFSGEGAH